jgi:hypothetical protein
MKPRKTPAAVLDRLASRVEELGEARHRSFVDSVVPQRAACERHGWSPEGPRPASDHWDAIASLCPACTAERRRAEREAEAPETITLDVYAGSLREQKAWQESRALREQAGHIFSGSTVEREALRVIDELRADEMALLRETPASRRRTHRDHWGRKLRVHTQRYEPHPARAGD